jgi:hypothetical protein
MLEMEELREERHLPETRESILEIIRATIINEYE